MADLVKAFLFLLEHPDVEGAIDFTAPEPVQNREMMHMLSAVLRKRPFVPVIPEGLFRLVLGEFSGEFLEGQRVIPRKLLVNGFAFQYPSLREALSELLNP